MKTARQSVVARRQTVLQVGIAIALFASVGLVTTACIFDEGNPSFQGGGRIGQAATAQQTSSSCSSGDDDDETSSSSSSSGFLPDGGLADAN